MTQIANVMLARLLSMKSFRGDGFYRLAGHGQSKGFNLVSVCGSMLVYTGTVKLYLIAAISAVFPAFAQAQQCDRQCLDKLVDSYLAAVVAHDPSRVAVAPIAPSVKFVENTVPTKPGDGLWKTASEAPTTFKIY